MPQLESNWAQVFKRDNYRCVYCGKYLLSDYDTFLMAEEDHLVPRAEKGTRAIDNLVACCSVCNRMKGNFVPADITLTPATRNQYLAAVRQYIMAQRAEKLNTFLRWTHPHQSA